MKNQYHFTYKTTNIINNKFYYGVHSTYNLDDGYIGSGKLFKLAVRKYKKENFKREIISFYDTRKDAAFAESLLITEEMVNDVNCYNVNFGGENTLAKHSDATKKKISVKTKGFLNPRYGHKWSNADKEKIAGFKGRNHTEETKAKMSIAQLSRTDTRKPLSDEAKKNISIANKGRLLGISLSEEIKNKMRKPKKLGHGDNVSKAKKGVKLSEQAKSNMRKPKTYDNVVINLDRNIKIVSKDDHGNILDIFENCYDALSSIGNNNVTSFTKAVKYGYKSGGLYWSYYNQ